MILRTVLLGCVVMVDSALGQEGIRAKVSVAELCRRTFMVLGCG
jgi:hypothetical protein